MDDLPTSTDLVQLYTEMKLPWSDQIRSQDVKETILMNLYEVKRYCPAD